MKGKIQSTLHKNISKIITVVCLTVFIYASYSLLNIFLNYYQNQNVMNDVQDAYYHESSRSVASAQKVKQDSHENSNSIRSGFDELLNQNEQVVGWITIEDTEIDYPILQSDNNIDFLTEDFNGNESIAGSIFLDYRNDIASSDQNVVVYGHRMKDGSMFQHLTKFLDEDFFESHKTFTFDTLYDSYEAEIFAVYNTLIDFNYIRTDFANDEEYDQLLSEIQDKSIYQTNTELSVDDQMLTLSTCEYTLDPNDSRLVIHAKLVKQ